MTLANLKMNFQQLYRMNEMKEYREMIHAINGLEVTNLAVSYRGWILYCGLYYHRDPY